MLERDAGEILWHTFKSYCQQRFGPAVTINHLADLARLPFRSSVSEYQDAFLSKMAHAGYLSQEQQVQLFTGGLPDAIRVDVELQAPQNLQRAMALARAYEQRSSTLAATIVWTSLGPLPQWVPGPTTRWAPGTTRLALHGT
jgi:hypothetical protein